MTLIHEKNALKSANEMIALESQIDEAIVFINSILGNFQTLKTALENDAEFSQGEIDEVQTALDNSKTKIRNYADSL